MLISIIVPVYNVEHYIRECIASILNQDFDDYEIILVDDGSKDDSGKICDEYAEKYENISVIHKANGGLSDARNAGLRVSVGEYILFVDSDDYIGNNSLKAIVDCLQKDGRQIDVMFLEAMKFFPDGKQYPMGDGYIADRINGCSKTEVMSHLAQLPKFPGSACTKLLRRKLLEQNNLYFENGLFSEDIEWTIRLLKVTQVFAYCDVMYYFYRQSRAGSITNTANIKNVESILSTIEKWSSVDLSIPYQKEINSFLAYEYIVVLFNYANLNKREKHGVYERIKNLRWITQFGISKKESLVKCSVPLLVIRGTALLLKIYRTKFE